MGTTKSLGKTLGLILISAVIVCFGARAQSNSDLQSDLPDSIVQLAAEAEGLSLVDPATLPLFAGCWWTVYPGGGPVPMPCPPLDLSVPIYEIVDGIYLVDETDGAVSANPGKQTMTIAAVAAALERQGNAITDLIEQVQETEFEQTMARSFGLGPPTPGESGDSGGSDYTNTYTSSFFIDTNLLWLEITNVSSGTVHANLHNGTNLVYAIWETTNLLTSWQVEMDLWPATNATSVMPFTLPTLNREPLFLRAEDWTDKDSNSDGLPDWWEWKYCHTLGLSATNDFDGDGTNILAEYTNSVDPNKISFSCSFPNQYASTSLVSGVITIFGGVPAYRSVLVDSTNFAGATWTAYASSNVTVNLGSTQGAHEVWIGLRGWPDDAHQTWQETTLVLASTAPAISITSPASNVSFNSSRVNVSGNFTSSALKQITVNGVPAFVNGTNFNAVNVPLAAGTNSLTALLEDLTDSTNVASINVITSTNTDGSLNNPVQLQATPVAGFAPLPVAFLIQANAPGTFQQTAYDFNGDSLADFATNNLNSFTYTYVTNGEYFPMVTIQTTAGQFSSVGGWNAVALDESNQPIHINVQATPIQTTFASITDPVDLKWVAPSNLYVLSRSTATITEFSTNGSAIRSLSGLGTSPSGFDVDAAGNVYVAVTASNQVWKFAPTSNSFAAVTNFGINGCLGLTNGASGSNTNAFNAPFDVAVSPDGGTIAVSDSGNNRIQQFSAANGAFIATFGTNGSDIGQFNTPKGLTYDSSGTLYIVDSGNSRIVLAQGSSVQGVTGTNGTVLGQFNNPVNLCIGTRGVYVADSGNNRIQKFGLPAHGLFDITPANIRFAVSTNLSGPYAVVAVNSFTNDLFYVADTGNNRVILCTAPTEDADAVLAVWNSMVSHVNSGDFTGAASYFSVASSDKYQQAFLSVGTANTISAINQIGTLTPAEIQDDTAQYYFEQVIAGQTITFPVEFVKENGLWKILEF